MGEEEIIERIAKALVMSRGVVIFGDDDIWEQSVKDYRAMCAKFPQYAYGHSTVTDAFRDARIAYNVMRGADA